MGTGRRVTVSKLEQQRSMECIPTARHTAISIVSLPASSRCVDVGQVGQPQCSRSTQCGGHLQRPTGIQNMFRMTTKIWSTFLWSTTVYVFPKFYENSPITFESFCLQTNKGEVIGLPPITCGEGKPNYYYCFCEGSDVASSRTGLVCWSAGLVTY